MPPTSDGVRTVGCALSKLVKMGAINIGTNFQRLMKGDSTIRSMTEQDLTFHRASQCMRVSDRRLYEAGGGEHRLVPYPIMGDVLVCSCMKTKTKPIRR